MFVIHSQPSKKSTNRVHNFLKSVKKPSPKLNHVQIVMIFDVSHRSITAGILIVPALLPCPSNIPLTHRPPTPSITPNFLIYPRKTRVVEPHMRHGTRLSNPAIISRLVKLSCRICIPFIVISARLDLQILLLEDFYVLQPGIALNEQRKRVVQRTHVRGLQNIFLSGNYGV